MRHNNLIPKLKWQIRQLQLQIEQNQVQMSPLLFQLEQLSTYNIELQAQIRRHEAESQELRAANITLEEQRISTDKALAKQVKQMEQAKVKLDEHAEQWIKEMGQTATTHQAQLDQAQAKLIEYNAISVTLHAELHKTDDLSTRFNESETRCKSLHAELHKADDLSTRFNESEARCKFLHAELRRLGQLRAQVVDGVSALSIANTKLKAAEVKEESNGIKMEALNDKIKDLKEQLAQTQDNQVDVDKENKSKIQVLNDKIKDLKEQLAKTKDKQVDVDKENEKKARKTLFLRHSWDGTLQRRSEAPQNPQVKNKP